MYIKKHSFYFVGQYTRLITCIFYFNTREIISFKIHKSVLRLFSEITSRAGCVIEVGLDVCWCMHEGMLPAIAELILGICFGIINLGL